MGLFNRLKTLAGGHGVTSRMTSVSGTFPNEAQLRLNRRTVEVGFQVSAEGPVDILGHRVTLRIGRPGGEAPFEAVVAEVAEDVAYRLQAGEQRDVTLELALDLPAALEAHGIDPDSAVQNDEIRWALVATADVKGTLLDAAARLDLRLMGVGEEWMTGDGWATDPGPPDNQLWIETPDQGNGARGCWITHTELRRVDDDTLEWVMTPADGRGPVAVRLPDPSDLHYSEGGTEVCLTEVGEGFEVTHTYTFLGWVIVTYRVGDTLRGYFNGRLAFAGCDDGALFGQFEVQR